MITKEDLERRLSELQKKLDQIQANGNATIGAISECEYWINSISAVKIPTEAPHIEN